MRMISHVAAAVVTGALALCLGWKMGVKAGWDEGVLRGWKMGHRVTAQAVVDYVDELKGADR